MSRLKLYWPDARGSINAAGPAPLSADQGTEPPVIPFARFRHGIGELQPDVLTRAHMIFANSRCPLCRHPVVEPLELNDAAIGRSNLPIPGTATLVGFRCERCDCEWQA